MRLDNTFSDCFNVSNGLKQGCLLSPMLFNLYINDLVNDINLLDKGLNVDGCKISMLLYADDIVLMVTQHWTFSLCWMYLILGALVGD